MLQLRKPMMMLLIVALLLRFETLQLLAWLPQLSHKYHELGTAC